MKLIKLSDTHYIITSDDSISEGDFVFQQNFERTNNQIIRIETEFQAKIANDKDGSFTKRKITHSFGQQLYGVDNRPLQEVEELTLGYNVEKMAEKETIKNEFNSEKSYIVGFNAHKELVKDKLFTVDDMKIALSEAFKASQEGYQITSNEIIQSLLPKEWSVTFDEQGKLKLI